MNDSQDTEKSTRDETDVLDEGKAGQPASGDDVTEGEDSSGGGLDPHAEPDERTKEEIEEERQRRLDPENRPENAEVDNTQRDFDVERGLFEDSEEYDESEPAPFSDPEDPNNADNSDAKDDAQDDPADDEKDDADDEK